MASDVECSGSDYEDYNDNLAEMKNYLDEKDENLDFDNEYEYDAEDMEGGLLVGGRVRHKPPCGDNMVESHRGETKYCRALPGMRMKGAKRKPSDWQMFVSNVLGSYKAQTGKSYPLAKATKIIKQYYPSDPYGAVEALTSGKGGMLLGGARPHKTDRRCLRTNAKTHRCEEYSNRKHPKRVVKGLTHCRLYKEGKRGARCAEMEMGRAPVGLLASRQAEKALKAKARRLAKGKGLSGGDLLSSAVQLAPLILPFL